MKRWLLIPLFFCACIAAQAELYRWVDADGKVHYSDQLPPANIKHVEKKKAGGGKPSEAPLPYVLQQAVKNFPVTLYATDCGDACTRARQCLAKRGIPYTDMDATDPAVRESLRKLTGGPLEVPVLKVGRDVVRGFEEGKWNTSLDAAGYPQSALIAPRVSSMPAKPAAAAPPVAPAPPAEASQ